MLLLFQYVCIIWQVLPFVNHFLRIFLGVVFVQHTVALDVHPPLFDKYDYTGFTILVNPLDVSQCVADRVANLLLEVQALGLDFELAREFCDAIAGHNHAEAIAAGLGQFNHSGFV